MPEAAYNLPDGPRTPLLLNGALFLVARARLMRYLQRRYGDAVTLRLPAVGAAVVTAHPDLVKTIFTAPATVLHGGKSPLGQVLGPGSLFSMDEERHLKERRMLLPPFHGERMRSYDGLIEAEALRAMESWPENVEFATLPTFNKITLRVILRAVFGAEGAELAELERLLPPATAVGQRLVTAPFLRRDLGPRSPGGKFRSMRARYDRIFGTLIDKHLADPHMDERIDILAMTLHTLRESGEEINRSELADAMLTLLVAGHETTASSLAWAVDRLRRHPFLTARLEQEAEGEDSTLRAATILEVQRTRPVIHGTGRVAMEPFQLGEYLLPPGTVMIAAAALIHQDERFHENAAAFDPDRYVEEKQPDDAAGEAGCRAIRTPATYAWIPFGGGRRRCLGAAFAQMEMDVVLRTLLRHFELLPASSPAERERFRGVAFAPAKGGMALVRRRRVPSGSAAEPVTAVGAAR